jgi:allantoicase
VSEQQHRPMDFRALPDVASYRLGGSVVYANDEFYAEAFNLTAPLPAAHDPLAFGRRGKVYDGWETRRRRERGADFAIVRLAAPTVVRGVNIDTSHFRGNYPPAASVEGVALLGYPTVAELLAADWHTLVPLSDIEGDSANVLAVADADGPERLVTHVKLTIEPDGGVARFRVYGDVVPDPRLLGGRVDLAAALHGAWITDCSNMFYSSPANVLSPGIATVMSDGWETARRRDDGNDWVVVQLAAAGVLHSAVIDTSCFIGNAPGWASISDALTGDVLLPRTRLLADTAHRFRLRETAPVDTVRLDIYPDGGLSRLRLHGEVAPAARAVAAKRWLDLLPPEQADLIDPTEFFD